MPDGTFRACSQAPHHDLMALQRNGIFEKRLREKGVRKIVVGEVLEEWYFYSLAHPINVPADVKTNLERYLPTDIVGKILDGEKLKGLGKEELVKRFGEILSDWQIYLPVRLMKRDMPSLVARYEIRWVPERLRKEGVWLPELMSYEVSHVDDYLQNMSLIVQIEFTGHIWSPFLTLKNAS
jgi:hypothetical protein